MVINCVGGVNYTTVLNIAALAVFAVLYWLYRNRQRFGGGARYVKDVVCGMQVEKAAAPARAEYAGHSYWFCSDKCRERFSAGPQRFLAGQGKAPARQREALEAADAVDPVCGMPVDPGSAAAHAGHEGSRHFFCSTGCRDSFAGDPGRYLTPAGAWQIGPGEAELRGEA